MTVTNNIASGYEKEKKKNIRFCCLFINFGFCRSTSTVFRCYQNFSKTHMEVLLRNMASFQLVSNAALFIQEILENYEKKNYKQKYI